MTQERLGELVLELRRLVQVLEAGTALHGQPVALADKGIPGQVRVLAGKQLYDVDAKHFAHFERKVKLKSCSPDSCAAYSESERPVAWAISASRCRDPHAVT